MLFRLILSMKICGFYIRANIQKIILGAIFLIIASLALLIYKNQKAMAITNTLGEFPYSCYWNLGKEIERNTLEKSGFGSIDRVVINSCGKRVYLLEAMPVSTHGKPEVVVALHQTTNSGKKEVMGFDGDKNLAYGRTFFESGFVVIAPDAFIAGENLDPATGWDTGAFYNEFPKWSAMGRMLIDNLSVVRYAEKKYSPQCMAVVGHSLGGHNALFLGAFEEKYRCRCFKRRIREHRVG